MNETASTVRVVLSADELFVTVEALTAYIATERHTIDDQMNRRARAIVDGSSPAAFDLNLKLYVRRLDVLVAARIALTDAAA